MKLTVYLAGPINGCSDSDAVLWREFIKTSLSGTSYEVKNPMVRDYRGKELEPGNDQAIVAADKDDIDSSDIVLANVWKTSVGTSMEILYAFERGKCVFLIHPDRKNMSPWLTAHSHGVFSTPLEASKALVRAAEPKHPKGIKRDPECDDGRC